MSEEYQIYKTSDILNIFEKGKCHILYLTILNCDHKTPSLAVPFAMRDCITFTTPNCKGRHK